MKVSVLFIALGAFAAGLQGACEPQIPLWPNGAPGSEGITEAETDEAAIPSRAYRKISSVHNPALTACLPAKANGTAVLLFPGGGHQFLAFDVEGTEVAEWLNSRGIAAFIVKYRLARAPKSTYKVEVHELQDALRAVRLVRGRAKEWNVDPARVGIMGFSAGGMVAALAGSRYTPGSADAADLVERVSSRPDFQVLAYASFNYEGELPKDLPPVLFVCATSDRRHAERTASNYLTLLKAGFSPEMYIYARGGHGFGMRDRNLGVPVATWNQRFEEWLGDVGMLGARR